MDLAEKEVATSDAAKIIRRVMRSMIVLFLALATAVSAADLALSDGRVFKDFRVVSQTAMTVLVRHAGGLAKVDKKLLPAEVLARYPIDEKGAAEEAAANARGKAEYEEQLKRAAEQARAEQKTKSEKRQATESELDAARQEGKRQAEVAAASAAGAKEAKLEDVQRKDADKLIADHNRLASGEVPKGLVAKIKTAAKNHAEMYFRNEYKRPSNELSLEMKTTLDEPRTVPGYSNRFEVTGSAWWTSYVSQGQSFTNNKTWFEATVEIDERGGARVADFALRSVDPRR